MTDSKNDGTQDSIPLGDNFEENIDRFYADAIDCGCVWGLEGPEGWALTASEKHSDSTVMPFWSQPEFAQVHCCDDWPGYQVVPVSLEEFIEDWLPGMHSDVYLVGVNWNENLEGEEMEPLDMLKEFEDALA
jgi:Protein of unknown function (DUF2750)